MREFQGKRRVKAVLYSRPFVIFLIILIFVLAHSVWGVWQRSQVVTADRDTLAAQLAEVRARHDGLAADTALLETDRGVEETIRQKFAVVKEGEEVITVVSTSTTATSTATTSWWQEFLGWFK